MGKLDRLIDRLEDDLKEEEEVVYRPDFRNDVDLLNGLFVEKLKNTIKKYKVKLFIYG